MKKRFWHKFSELLMLKGCLVFLAGFGSLFLVSETSISVVSGIVGAAMFFAGIEIYLKTRED